MPFLLDFCALCGILRTREVRWAIFCRDSDCLPATYLSFVDGIPEGVCQSGEEYSHDSGGVALGLSRGKEKKREAEDRVFIPV